MLRWRYRSHEAARIRIPSNEHPEIPMNAPTHREYEHPARRSVAFKALDSIGIDLPLGRFAMLARSSPRGAVSQLLYELRAPRIPGRSVVIFALPKSGSTLTELVFRTLGYTGIQHAVGCRSRTCGADTPADKRLQHMFGWVREGHPAFAKTHLPFHPALKAAMERRRLGGIVQIRDIRDALISRYHHVMADRRHRHHAMLRDLPEIEGIKRSFFGERPGAGDDPITYFSAWIADWISASEFPVVKYEELCHDEESFLRALLEAAGRDVQDLSRLRSVLAADRELAASQTLDARLRGRGKGFSTFRKGEAGGWRQTLDQEAIDLVKRHANHALVASGYESDDRW